MKKIVFLILIIPFFSFSGNENYAIGGRSTGMGNTGLCLSNVWAIRYNQASLADISIISGAISYQNNFLIKSLGIQSLAFVLPTKSGTFGINYTGVGDNIYKESKIGVGYGMKLSEKLNLGIRLNYHQLKFGSIYGIKQNLTFEIGLLSKINKKLKIGLHIFNPLSAKLLDYENEIIPVIYNFGINYIFSKIVNVNIEFEKDIDTNPNVKIGMEYMPVKNMYLRAGIETYPMQPSIGFGIIYKKFQIDISSSFHQTLGVSPALGIVYNLK